MNASDFLTALALLLIFEGLMPFANPAQWKQVLSSISNLENSKIRLFGFFSIIGGLLLLYSLG